MVANPSRLISMSCSAAAVDVAMFALKVSNGLLNEEIAGGVKPGDTLAVLERNLKARDRG